MVYVNYIDAYNGAIFEDDSNDANIKVKIGAPFMESTTVAGIFGVFLDRFQESDDTYLDSPRPNRFQMKNVICL